jgi:leucyl aminopeptidase (aminopeptidase T)
MLKEELMECVDKAYEYGKKLIVMWNDYSMQQIRLKSANDKRIEESRQHHINEMDERKTLRYKAQKQANYVAWRNSPDYDPEKDTYKND